MTVKPRVSQETVKQEAHLSVAVGTAETQGVYISFYHYCSYAPHWGISQNSQPPLLLENMLLPGRAGGSQTDNG